LGVRVALERDQEGGLVGVDLLEDFDLCGATGAHRQDGEQDQQGTDGGWRELPELLDQVGAPDDGQEHDEAPDGDVGDEVPRGDLASGRVGGGVVAELAYGDASFQGAADGVVDLAEDQPRRA